MRKERQEDERRCALLLIPKHQGAEFSHNIQPMKLKILLLVLFIAISGTLMKAQDVITISGRVIRDHKQTPLPYCTVTIANTGTRSDEAGNFILKVNANDADTLIIRSVGYKTKRIAVSSSDAKLGDIVLQGDKQSINEVTVVGEKHTSKLIDKAIPVSAIDVTKLKSRTITSIEILAQLPGVRIRQNGGLGSNNEISIMGMKGKAVKQFIDGIPIEFLGQGFDITHQSLENVSAIEVYKGVTPVSLGTDALGGAVNIVTNQNHKNKLSASVEYGSFNTQKVNVQGTIASETKKLYFSPNISYMYSDNNYTVDDIDIVDANTGKSTVGSAKKFHDAYKNIAAGAKLGITNTKFANDLFLNIAYSDIDKEVQQGYTFVLQYAYGEVEYWVNTTSYFLHSNKHFLNDKLYISADFGYNVSNTELLDVSSNRYNWQGEVSYVTDDDTGELGGYKSHAFQRRASTIGKQTITYDSKIGEIQLSSTQSFFNRTGRDDSVKAIIGYNPFEVKSTVDKVVTGLGLESKFANNRLSSVISLKHYYNKVFGAPYQQAESEETYTVTNSDFGGNITLKYNISENLSARVSYEQALRLPDEMELLGDGVYIGSNLKLKPEQSHNVSVGMIYLRRNDDSRYRVELNGFYRRIRDLIILRQLGILPIYNNWNQAKGFGLDADIAIQPKKWFKLGGNLTFVDMRKRGYNSYGEQYLDGMRIPNTPYFFYNLNMELSKEGLLNRNDNKISMFMDYQYVYEFNLYYAGNINNEFKEIIPTQNILNTGINYSICNGRYSVSLESNNILNNKLYDNYKIQKPGRNYRIKLMLSL